MNLIEPLLNTHELCRLLGVSRSTLWRLRQEGLPHLFVRGRPRFDQDEVLAWLESGPADEAEPEEQLLPGDYRCRQCGFIGAISEPRPASKMWCPTCSAVNPTERV